MKKMFAILMSLMLITSFMTGTTAVAFAKEPEVSNTWQVTSDNMEITDFKVTKDGFYAVASYGPYIQDPTGKIVDADMQTIVGSATFYITVPDGMTLNTLYFIGGNEDGYGTTAAVDSVGDDVYMARTTGVWFRVSPKNMNISGGTTIAVIVVLQDKTNPYNIVINGRQ